MDKEVGDRIRNMGLDGVKVDEDFKRYYPYEELASKVLGFTGGDNQGIIGLEVKYEEYLEREERHHPDHDGRQGNGAGRSGGRPDRAGGRKYLQISLDYNIQTYAQQMAEKVMEEKQAERVAILLMNPQNGEILCHGQCAGI